MTMRIDVAGRRAVAEVVVVATAAAAGEEHVPVVWEVWVLLLV
jgi:hypothetical protein